MLVNIISFSVVIPVLNGEKFISKAIESCLSQTVQPNEIVVVDDGSTDQTEAVVRSIDSGLVRFIKSEEKVGPSAARNKGIRSATSSWILFLDADDIFHRRKIEIILHCIQNNKTIQAIGHSFAIIEDQEFGNDLVRLSDAGLIRKLSVLQVLMRNPMVTPSLAVAKENGIFFNEKLSYAEDHDFILRTTQNFGFWYIDVPLCYLHRLPLTLGGLSSSKWQMRKGEMRMFIDFCKRSHLYLLIPFFLLFSLMKHIRNAFVLYNIR